MQKPVSSPTPAVVADNPRLETASAEGRVIADLPGLVHPGELPIEYIRRRLPFAAQFQAILIVVMFAAFMLILQQPSQLLFISGQRTRDRVNH